LEFAGVKLKPSSYDRRLRTINSLAPHFSGKSVASISKLDVEEWAAKRTTICKARTFNMEIETLRLAFDYAMSHGLVLDNPASHIDRLKLSRLKLHIPTRQEFKELLATIRQCRLMTKGCDESQAAGNLVEFLGYSGCRLAEAVGDHKFSKPPLLWGDVNFKLCTFTVTGKGVDQGKTRTVPLFPALERLLREMKSKLPAVPKAGEPVFNIQSAKKAIETVCRRLGLPGQPTLRQELVALPPDVFAVGHIAVARGKTFAGKRRLRTDHLDPCVLTAGHGQHRVGVGQFPHVEQYAPGRVRRHGERLEDRESLDALRHCRQRVGLKDVLERQIAPRVGGFLADNLRNRPRWVIEVRRLPAPRREIAVHRLTGADVVGEGTFAPHRRASTLA
jgi:site-specific recombinase XerD